MERPASLHAIIVLISLTLGGCASFSVSRSAQVEQGFGFHAKGGYTGTTSKETTWFYDLLDDGCPLCEGQPLGVSDVGVTYGRGRTSYGLFAAGAEPQFEIYRQLHDGSAVDFGVGGRVGLMPKDWRSAQLFALFDRSLGRDVRLMINPGVYYHTGQSPDHSNSGSFLFFTPSVGVAIEKGPVTLTPSVTLVTGSGHISRSGESRRDFTDTFMSASIGVSFHKKK